MSILNTGPGLYASLNTTNPPTDLSEFDAYLNAGLSRFLVFTFVPNDNLPTTADWYTTVHGNQPQGLDTYGGATTDQWADFFDLFVQQEVQVGFTFGGQNATSGLVSMMESLNNDHAAFADFVATLQSYHVSFIQFDIEGSWATINDSTNQFETFAENMTSVSQGTIAIEIGASSPIGTVNNEPSDAPAYLTQAFVEQNNIYFNVYTYYDLEVDNVVSANTPWIPTTDIEPGHILFSVTCNSDTPASSGQMDYADFMASFPSSDILSCVKVQHYVGFDTWVWWPSTTTYPSENCINLFQASAT